MSVAVGLVVMHGLLRMKYVKMDRQKKLKELLSKFVPQLVLIGLIVSHLVEFLTSCLNKVLGLPAA
jgi:hypothetical protein